MHSLSRRLSALEQGAEPEQLTILVFYYDPDTGEREEAGRYCSDRLLSRTEALAPLAPFDHDQVARKLRPKLKN